MGRREEEVLAGGRGAGGRVPGLVISMRVWDRAQDFIASLAGQLGDALAHELG